MSAEKLHTPRARIDEIDRRLVALVAERMDAVRAIGRTKGADDAQPLRDHRREQEVLANWQDAAAEHGLSPFFAGRILREVMNYSRRVQEELLDRPQDDATAGAAPVRVGRIGSPGSYSDLALTKLFAERGEGALTPVAFAGFTAAVDALERDEVDFAFLPIENTIAGSLNETYALLTGRDLHIVDEEILPVEHIVAGRPGADLAAVRVVRSHPVALQQCAAWLGARPGCRAEACADSATAAQIVADGDDPTAAAICSEEAASRLGLQVLARGIADQALNATRFVLMGRAPAVVDRRRPARTSLVLSVNHRRGSLAKCLDAFARRRVNLTKLESRPRPESPWEYVFYIDIEGHRDSDRVREALDEVATHANTLKVLGCYPRRGSFGDDLEPEEHLAEWVGAAAPDGRKPLPVVDPNLRRSARTAAHEPSIVKIGRVPVGGGHFMLIAGPCAVESRAQVTAAAKMVQEAGGQVLRGGAFKPRTSPYSFQGLGFPGLELLRAAGDTYDLPIVTEVLRVEDVAKVARMADALQVGARNMQNFELLKELGRTDKPVLLKRGMSATVKDLLAAAEYIMAGGNQQVILCERGIRTFETATRSTLDLSAVPVLKERTHLPVIVDPSHAAGRRELVLPLAAAAVAAGADGLIVECHPNPDEALCDKEQALTGADMAELVGMARRMGRMG
ncbi:3-deoxy-7-phosphoheptulonate synthase [bacterium]|nr:3-deoxy-7-phosphoheptulonate synthase [bacterium]